MKLVPYAIRLSRFQDAQKRESSKHQRPGALGRFCKLCSAEVKPRFRFCVNCRQKRLKARGLKFRLLKQWQEERQVTAYWGIESSLLRLLPVMRLKARSF